jgi:hypothetical protein
MYILQLTIFKTRFAHAQTKVDQIIQTKNEIPFRLLRQPLCHGDGSEVSQGMTHSIQEELRVGGDSGMEESMQDL